MKYQKITKREAFKMWMDGSTIYLQPCNFSPDSMWKYPMSVNHTDYIEEVKMYNELDKKYPNTSPNAIDYTYSNDTELNRLAWNMMYNNWAFYNTNYEMGYYAHYYKLV